MRELIAKMLDDPSLRHVYFDLSWSETAKYLTATSDTPKQVARIIAAHPDRFLFGTDEVAPKTQTEYLRVLRLYDPLWRELAPATVEQVQKRNYERLFDAARRDVRAWEARHVTARSPGSAAAATPQSHIP